jgi:phosphomannomutase
MNLSAFKAYDIRGKYPEEVNEELAYLVGRAVARYFSAKVIVVGRDMRTSSPILSEKLIEGIICEGANVVNIGLCTTPMLNFAVASCGYDGGVMISASHNPGGDNAFKVINRNVLQLSDSEGLNDIRNLIQAGFGDCASTQGSVTEKNVLNDYLNHIKKQIGGISPLKVVADYGNGVGAISGSPMFKNLNINIEELYAEPNGDFPNHPANPHDISNFNDLINHVKESKADVGIFFDGDADRSVIVDDKARIVPVDLQTVLLAQQELKIKKTGNVYYDLRFSKAVPALIEAVGGTPVMMRVGNPFYKKILKEKGGVMGAEFSGHIMFPENFCMDDGLFAALKTMRLINQSGKKLSDMIDEITVFEASPEESMEAKTPETVFDRIKAAFPDGKQIELDGVYLDFTDGFISVRRSNPEPQLFRIRVEAKTKSVMADRLNKAKTIVLEG